MRSPPPRSTRGSRGACPRRRAAGGSSAFHWDGSASLRTWRGPRSFSLPTTRATSRAILWPWTVAISRVGSGPARPDASRGRELPAKRRHDLSGEPRELLDHELSRRSDRPRDHDVVQPGIPPLDLFQVGDDVFGRTAEPGAIANAVLQGGRGGRLCLPRDHRLHVLFAVAQHAQRGHDLRMLLEVRPRLLNRALGGLVDAHPEAEDQILSELELSTMAARHRLIVAEPALDELLGGRGHDALDAVPGHEVEAPRAPAHDRLPVLHRLPQRARHQRDLSQRVPAIGHVGGNGVALAWCEKESWRNAFRMISICSSKSSRFASASSIGLP